MTIMKTNIKGYKYFTLNALLLLNVFFFYNADSFAQENKTSISIAEVAPNILMVVYARTNPNDHWQSEIVSTCFNVKRVVE